MTTAPPKGSKKSGPREPDHGHSVVRAAFYAIGSVATAIGTILLVAGSSATEDGTVRYALTVLLAVAALAMAVAALYLWRR